MTDEDSALPPPPIPKAAPPLMAHTFAALGWTHRAANAVGSDRFAETLRRAEFCFSQAAQHARTPGEAAIITGLQVTLDELIVANAQARRLLSESTSGMNLAEATEFTELCEGEDDIPLH